MLTSATSDGKLLCPVPCCRRDDTYRVMACTDPLCPPLSKFTPNPDHVAPTLGEKFSKADYIERCSARFQERGGFGLEVSLSKAQTCFACRKSGSTPEDDADVEMAARAEDLDSEED